RSLFFLAALDAFLTLALCAGAEQPLEDQPRISLGRDRRRGRAPSEVVLIGTRIARVAVAGLACRLAGEFQRWEAREMADLVGDELVDRNAGMDVGAGRFAHAHTGEERAIGAGVIARAVGTGGRVYVIQAGEDLNVLLERLQRLHGLGQLEVGSIP